MAYVFLWSKPFLIGIGFMSVGGGFLLAYTLPTTLTTLVSESVFNGLLVVISIFIGYVSVIVIFYLGKMDDHEREYLRTLVDVRSFEQELFSALHQLYSKISAGEHRTQIEEVAREDLRGWLERVKTDPLYTKERRDNILNETRDFRYMTIRWGIFSLLTCLFALFASITGSLLVNSDSHDFIMSLLSCVLVIISLNIFMLILFWYSGQYMMNVYRKSMVQLRDYIDLELAKVVIDFSKHISDENKKKG